VVEDIESFREFTYSILRMSAVLEIIGEASDELEAVNNSEKLQPDLIFLDIGLASLNGIEIAKRIRKLAPRSKMQTGAGESGSASLRRMSNLAATFLEADLSGVEVSALP
jgi:DNA-binding NarL/FixJ family response regulator